MTTLGKCRLCLNDRVQLRNSHFFPAAAYKIMREFTVREGRFKNPNPVRLTDLCLTITVADLSPPPLRMGGGGLASDQGPGVRLTETRRLLASLRNCRNQYLRTENSSVSEGDLASKGV